jgi:NAD(P)-dependent dehydrogenase (short-subunit alcohol dehydrogenase family)
LFQNAVVRGTLLGFQYLGKDKGGKGGVVVNIASIVGLARVAGCPVYVGTKYAVIGITRSFGVSMPKHNGHFTLEFKKFSTSLFPDTDYRLHF